MTISPPVAAETRVRIELAGAYGERRGWLAVEISTPAAELAGLPGVGDAATLVYTRGTGRGAQRVTAHYRPLDDAPGTVWQYVGTTIDGIARGLSWIRIAETLSAPRTKVRRAARGTRPRCRARA